jgi:hypothetical protein
MSKRFSTFAALVFTTYLNGCATQQSYPHPTATSYPDQQSLPTTGYQQRPAERVWCPEMGIMARPNVCAAFNSRNQKLEDLSRRLGNPELSPSQNPHPVDRRGILGEQVDCPGTNLPAGTKVSPKVCQSLQNLNGTLNHATDKLRQLQMGK